MLCIVYTWVASITSSRTLVGGYFTSRIQTCNQRKIKYGFRPRIHHFCRIKVMISHKVIFFPDMLSTNVMLYDK